MVSRNEVENFISWFNERHNKKVFLSCSKDNIYTLWDNVILDYTSYKIDTQVVMTRGKKLELILEFLSGINYALNNNLGD